MVVVSHRLDVENLISSVETEKLRVQNSSLKS